jgi:hypothetical protein
MSFPIFHIGCNLVHSKISRNAVSDVPRAAHLANSSAPDALACAAVQEVVLESSLITRPGVAPADLLLPDSVQSWPLPLYRAEAFAAHAAVEDPPEVGEFKELCSMPLEVRVHSTALECNSWRIPLVAGQEDQLLCASTTQTVCFQDIVPSPCTSP